MENYTDYKADIALRNIAVQLGIDLTNNPSPNDLFLSIESNYPKVAEIVLEEMFEKDKLKDYLSKIPPPETVNGNIVMEGDENLENYWFKLYQLYPQLLQAIESYKSK